MFEHKGPELPNIKKDRAGIPMFTKIGPEL